MRIALSGAPVVLALALSACASGATTDRYNTSQRQLTDDCRARGGILVPTGQQSGRPQNDNVCKINAEPGLAPHSPG